MYLSHQTSGHSNMNENAYTPHSSERILLTEKARYISLKCVVTPMKTIYWMTNIHQSSDLAQ